MQVHFHGHNCTAAGAVAAKCPITAAQGAKRRPCLAAQGGKAGALRQAGGAIAVAAAQLAEHRQGVGAAALPRYALLTSRHVRAVDAAREDKERGAAHDMHMQMWWLGRGQKEGGNPS